VLFVMAFLDLCV